MTDRYVALTVALEKDLREDDAELLISAIQMLKGVLKVVPEVDNPSQWTTEQRVRFNILEELIEMVRTEK